MKRSSGGLRVLYCTHTHTHTHTLVQVGSRSRQKFSLFSPAQGVVGSLKQAPNQSVSIYVCTRRAIRFTVLVSVGRSLL